MENYIENMDDEIRCGHLVSAKMKRVWNIQLNMAVRLIDICKKYNLRVWADSGTLLGTIRHKGFIPWDDDMDFVMPREDYDKLQKIGPTEFRHPFFFQSSYTDKNYFEGFAKIRYNDSCMMDENEYQYPTKKNMGIAIDIFILDDVPNSTESCMQIFNNLNLSINYMRHRTEWKYLFLPHKLVSCIAEGIKLKKKAFYNNNRLFRDIEESLRNNNYNSGLWSMVTFSGKPHVIRNKSEHSETIYMPFEKIMMPINNGYDEVLRNYYGNYMVLVKGTQKHSLMVLDDSRSYRDYVKEIKLNYWGMFIKSSKTLLDYFKI